MARKFTGLGVTLNKTHTAKPREASEEWLAPDAAGTGAAETAVYVGDLTGRIIGELDAAIEGVAWKLSDYGQARLTLPRTSATTTAALLRPGNRLLIQFGNGLPDWGGVIDLPRKWEDGRVGVVAYSGERLLVDRITDRGRYFSNVTAGEIFKALINEAVPIGVEVGQVWMGGELHGPDYHFRGLHDIFTKSLSGRIEQADWDVTARLMNGRIVFRANYYKRKGRVHGRQLALVESVNLAEVDMQEQGPLVNEWHMAGAGTGWGDTTRKYTLARDTTSVARYGLRQRGEIRVDVLVQETLERSAAVALAGSKAPHAVISLTAIDRPPARFGQYGVGDTILVELASAGFDGYEAAVRIKAREFLPSRNVCALVIE